jgi:serpin B
MLRRLRSHFAGALLLAALAPALATAGDAKVGLSDDGRVTQVDTALLAQARSGDAAASEKLFAADLVAALAREQRGNLALSPASIFDALARLAPGARGATAAALARAMHSATSSAQLLADVVALERALTGGDATLRIASAAWLQAGYPVRDAYSALLAEAGSPLRSTDFGRDPEASRVEINDWIAEHTAGRIRDMLPPGVFDAMTRLVLANAVALDAEWMTPFRTSATADATFATPSGQRSVSTMHLLGSLDYLEARSWRAVRLPYRGGRLDALVVLPDAGVDPLSVLPAVMSTASSDAFSTARVQLALPRFEVRHSINLGQPLAALGLGSMFSNAADLSGIGGNPGDLVVGSALHRAWLSVDEYGTKGAAATAITVFATSLRRMPDPIDFTVDRPFLFVVEAGGSGVPLFVARVTDPA